VTLIETIGRSKQPNLSLGLKDGRTKERVEHRRKYVHALTDKTEEQLKLVSALDSMDAMVDQDGN
jgi:hypothetical protein